MKVSVVIPTFNSERFLRDAVESALAQPQAEEVLLIDDGSTDATLDLCRSLAKAEPRLRVLHHPDHSNRGISVTRNLGISSARCEWVAFLDSDDTYLPGRFDELERLAAERNDFNGVYEAVARLPFEAPVPETFTDEQLITLRGRPEPSQLFEWLLQHKGDWFHTNGVALRKPLLESLGLFDTQLKTHEDTTMWYKASIVGTLLPGRLDRPVAIMRQRAGSITHVHSQMHKTGRYGFTLRLLRWALQNGVSRSRLELMYERHFAHVLQRMHQHRGVLLEKTHMLVMLARVAARDPKMLGGPACRRFLAQHSGLGRFTGQKKNKAGAI